MTFTELNKEQKEQVIDHLCSEFGLAAIEAVEFIEESTVEEQAIHIDAALNGYM